MRPHRLAFRALGPYPGEIEIDFDKLVTDALFLIWGPTGGGKTFLLDALCFALYGKAPGERPLPSDQRPHEVSPWVELEFAAQGERWRIRRIPLHERAVKRGSGTTVEQASATLEQLVDGMWQPVARKMKDEVNPRVEQLLGLTASQFQQVVLLPQGRFAEVLRSGSEERERLLQTLFDTSVYKSAVGWLDDQAKQRRATSTDFGLRLRGLRLTAADRWREVFPNEDDLGSPAAHDLTNQRQAGTVLLAVDSDGPPDGLDDGSADGANTGESTDTPWPADQDQFDDLVDRAQSAAASAGDAEEAAVAAHSSASDHHGETVQLAERWDRRESLRQELNRLVDAESSINAQRKSLDRADAAEVLRQVLDDEKNRRDEFTQCAEEVREHYAALREKLAGAPSLPDDVAIPPTDDPALQNRLTQVRTQIALHLDKLSEFVEDACTASQRESDAAAQRESAEDHLERQRQLDNAAHEHDAEKDEAEERLSEATSAADRVSGLRDIAAGAHERAAAAADLQALIPEFSSATENLRVAREATIGRRNEELDLRHQYLDGIAAVLAGELADGLPCPVCGSTEHPTPPEPAEDAVSAEQLEAVSAAVERAVEAEKLAGENLQSISSSMNTMRGRAGDVADDPDTAASQAASAAAELADAAELAGERPALREAVADLQGKAESARRQSGEAATAAALALSAAEMAAGAAESLRSKISQSIGDVDLDEAIVGLEAVKSCLSDLQESVARHAGARTALDALADTVTAQLEASPFRTSDEARSALLSSADRDRLRSDVESHDNARRVTEHDLSANDLQDLPDDRPDTDATREAAESAGEVARIARNRHASIAGASVAIHGWAAEHQEMNDKYAQALEDAGLWTAVADRCGGRLPPKVSLQRWVLSAYLEQICEFANRRLSAMTSGRYQLSVHRDRERRNAKGGLGLRVHDAHTGAVREVSTLSGGETFQASLALALGVADVVTARTGGVRLEVLFVDEGFGSLDSEALQLAMDELDRLREGGRAVGLISHVAELRERIRTGIEVRPTDSGSEINVGAFSEV
ncbi:MAG: AAA family ATPase [Acidimicrobiaceae bacterium]|nr:AAA family ATPase [Acidimicrobiaceae bacterium]